MFSQKWILLQWESIYLIIYNDNNKRICTVDSGIWKHEYGLKCCFRFLKQSQDIHWSQ
jgi:hypothetical protein